MYDPVRHRLLDVILVKMQIKMIKMITFYCNKILILNLSQVMTMAHFLLFDYHIVILLHIAFYPTLQFSTYIEIVFFSRIVQ